MLSAGCRRALSRGFVNRVASAIPAKAAVGATRTLMVQEYVSMELMKSFGINTPTCYEATTPEEVGELFKVINPPDSNSPPEAILKAQVLTGGRGKGSFDSGLEGGVKFVTSDVDASEKASQMLGFKLFTNQAPNGIICNKVLIRECFDITKELYLSIVMDRESQGPMVVACPEGGTSIEEVAVTNPELIFTEPIDIEIGITDEQCSRMASNLGLDVGSDKHTQAMELIKNLYTMFLKCDCTQVEINPLADTGTDLVVADAKINFDDRAADRQASIFEHRDFSQEDPREVVASNYDFNYVALDGSIGCMVNGAGLSMANMDLIASKGAKPACFLDVGGAATEAEAEAAFDLLNKDDFVKVIFVNIFGGIVRCDMIANGIIGAVKKFGLVKPIVVRLEGTNAEQGRQMIVDSGLGMIAENDWEKAASIAIDLHNQ